MGRGRVVLVCVAVVVMMGLNYELCSGREIKTRLIFWYTVNPGFPPKAEWGEKDSAKELYKEMLYGNMRARKGSREYFARLRRLGFDVVVLNGFHGPYNPRNMVPTYPGSLGQELQVRNAEHYVTWANEAGLTVLLQTMFFSENTDSSFSWFNDEDWKHIVRHIRFAAATARQLKAKGLSFDLEPYNTFAKNNPWPIKKWIARGRDRAAVLQAMYKRGREMAEAIQSEFPEAAVHLYDIGAGNASIMHRRERMSAQQLIGDDLGDVTAYFLGGFGSVSLGGGVYIDEASTAGVYEPEKIEELYKRAQVMYVENVVLRWRDESFRGKVAIGLELMAHLRTDSKKYWDMVKGVDAKRMCDAVRASTKVAGYVWLYPGETDWIYPELGDELALESMTLTGAPYKTHTERMKALSESLKTCAGDKGRR